jgi:cell wall-associated NlpC family hydrolase
MKRGDIVTVARALVGTPYQHQGRVAGLALDCAGVPVHCATTLGIPLTDYTRYGRLPVPAEMRAALDANLQRIPTKDMQPGDVAWMRFDMEPQHLAIVGDYVHGGLSLIHAYNGAGLNRVVEHRLDEVWRARIVAAWRYPGVGA